MSAVYGPVPSWRLGRSLGVDLISTEGKTCTFDCVYCQLGRTACLSDQRQVFVGTEQLQAELAIVPPIELDYVTFSGRGEPTLAANLAGAIHLCHTWPPLEGVPTAVLTNASLLSMPDVRRDLARAGLVVAKLDAPDEALFHAINRPITGVTWNQVVDGIRAFGQEFDGTLALQMMFVTANLSRAAELAHLACSLQPDELQLNTPLRPSPTLPLSPAEMAEVEAAFAGLPFKSVYNSTSPVVTALDDAEMRHRRPFEGAHRPTGRG